MEDLLKISETGYTCGYCGLFVGPNVGYEPSNGYDKIYICPNCEKPTYKDYSNTTFTPSPSFGEKVINIPIKMLKSYMMNLVDV
jgi:hypothetical protein